MDTEADIESEFYGNEFETDSDNNLEVEITGNKLLLLSPRNEFETDCNDNVEIEVAGNKSLLLGLCSTEYNILEDSAYIIEFNIMRFSPPAKLAFAIID